MPQDDTPPPQSTMPAAPPVPPAPASRINVALRFMASAVLVYLFVIVLMTASAQTRVAERLAKIPVDYSTGYAAWAPTVNGNPALEALKATVRARTATLQRAEEERETAKYTYYTFEAKLHNLLAKMSAVPACDIKDKEFGIEQIPTVMSDITMCMANPMTPPLLHDSAQKLIAGMARDADAALAARKADRTVTAIQADLKEQLRLLNAAQEELKNLKPTLDSFNEMNVLGHSWLVGGGLLIEFPPAMIQILLAFASGLFGGLLITLVLVVYPRSTLQGCDTPQATSDPTLFAPRILLGGLISLCVFIVLGGGAAVMGSGSPLAQGDTNFLAFCAVGILAGMFSDRVAHWLSERADNFFRKADPPAPAPVTQ